MAKGLFCPRGNSPKDDDALPGIAGRHLRDNARSNTATHRPDLEYHGLMLKRRFSKEIQDTGQENMTLPVRVSSPF